MESFLPNCCCPVTGFGEKLGPEQPHEAEPSVGRATSCPAGETTVEAAPRGGKGPRPGLLGLGLCLAFSYTAAPQLEGLALWVHVVLCGRGQPRAPATGVRTKPALAQSRTQLPQPPPRGSPTQTSPSSCGLCSASGVAHTPAQPNKEEKGTRQMARPAGRRHPSCTPQTHPVQVSGQNLR